MRSAALEARYGPKLAAAQSAADKKAVVTAATVSAWVVGVRSAASKSAPTAKAISAADSNVDLGAPLGDAVGFGETAEGLAVDGADDTPTALQALLDGIPGDCSSANVGSVCAYSSEAGAVEAYTAGGVAQLDVTGDGCDFCQSMADGSPYDVDSDDLPPYHPGCGCSADPHDDDDDDSGDTAADRAARGLRHARGRARRRG